MSSICGHESFQRIGILVFHSVVIASDNTMIDADHYDYTKRSKGNFVLKSLYVGDLLITRNDVELPSNAKCLIII